MQICILNHHTRDVSAIVEAVRREGREPEVFTDTSDWNKTKGATRYLGVYTNYVRILKSPTKEARKVILHDDVTVEPGLFDRIEHVLGYAPEAPVAFYNPDNAGYQQAQQQGRHVLATHGNFWTQCLTFAVSDIPPILEWFDRHIVPGICAEDGALWRYLTRSRKFCYAVVPSLVQHVGYDRSTFGIGAKVGKNLRKSGTYDAGFDVTKVHWQREFSSPFFDRSSCWSTEGLKDIT